MLTTEAGMDKKQEGKAAGATGWIVKPFDPDQLIVTIRKVMGYAVMAIDMRQLQACFFGESGEGLDAMESGLLSLEAAGSDLDTVNTIFRAAHSIKGGAATFGFKAITNTTHLLESLLDQVRGPTTPAGSTLIQRVP